MLPPTTRELDACGIGFVADAQGRPSRAIVAAALRGLACVKHRGAVAADARTADGSGLLVPIPPALFGEGAGVAVLFVRGDDPRAAVEAAAAAEGVSLVDWREPPLDPAALGDLARATGAAHRARRVLGRRRRARPRPSGGRCACAGASRRRPRAPTWCRARSARWSTRASPPPTPSPTSTSTCTTRRSPRRSRCSTSASPPTRCRRGSGPSPSARCATTARSTPCGATSGACGAGPSSAPRRSASGPRSCSARCSTTTTPTRACSTPPPSC